MSVQARRIADIASWRKILEAMEEMKRKVMKESEEEYSRRREERRDEVVKWLDSVAENLDGLCLEPVRLRVGMDHAKLLFWGWYAVAGESPQYCDWRLIPDKAILEKRRDGFLLWRASQEAWRLSCGKMDALPDDLVENWDSFQAEIYGKIRQFMRKKMDDALDEARKRLSKLERLNNKEEAEHEDS